MEYEEDILLERFSRYWNHESFDEKADCVGFSAMDLIHKMTSRGMTLKDISFEECLRHSYFTGETWVLSTVRRQYDLQMQIFHFSYL